MNCQEFLHRLDEYREGSLPRHEQNAANVHVRSCKVCQERIARADVLRRALRDLPAPIPQPNFFEQAFAHARPPRRPPTWPYVAGAAAAGLALWFGAHLFSIQPAPNPQALTTVTITLHEPRTVQLAFNATEALERATLSIRLPEGIEIEGFPGEREIRWETSLARGVNILPLPLIATTKSGGALLARLEHGDRSREVAISLRVDERARQTTTEPKAAIPASGTVVWEKEGNGYS